MDCDELKQIFMWDPFLTDQCKCKLKFGMGSNVTQVWYSVLAREPVQQDGATFVLFCVFIVIVYFFELEDCLLIYPSNKGILVFHKDFEKKKEIYDREFLI